eukprot:TRINITY_DN17720_c1_g1_i1.p3 TRINITY_DN17720_c1_g1~~TRINITY_DN17720_c1_g1_i1.p3  ORF type:complete len:343 (+),score=33.89 TRINITY_DN17720_c1_g1_i1:76-1029(+)
MTPPRPEPPSLRSVWATSGALRAPVVGFLDARSVCVAGRLDRRWREAVETPQVWTLLVAADFFGIPPEAAAQHVLPGQLLCLGGSTPRDLYRRLSLLRREEGRNPWLGRGRSEALATVYTLAPRVPLGEGGLHMCVLQHQHALVDGGRARGRGPVRLRYGPGRGALAPAAGCGAGRRRGRAAQPRGGWSAWPRAAGAGAHRAPRGGAVRGRAQRTRAARRRPRRRMRPRPAHGRSPCRGGLRPGSSPGAQRPGCGARRGRPPGVVGHALRQGPGARAAAAALAYQGARRECVLSLTVPEPQLQLQPRASAALSGVVL